MMRLFRFVCNRQSIQSAIDSIDFIWLSLRLTVYSKYSCGFVANTLSAVSNNNLSVDLQQTKTENLNILFIIQI